jgi:hypothetical protein
MDNVVRLCATTVTASPISSAEELARYSISVRDFEKAQEYVCAARKHLLGSLEYDALLFAAIVSYCRPFSPNEKSKLAMATSRLRIEDFGPLTDPEKGLHERLEELRNKALAHSESELNPTKFHPQTKVFTGRSFSLSNETLDLDAFEAIFVRFAEICHTKRADYSRDAP